MTTLGVSDKTLYFMVLAVVIIVLDIRADRAKAIAAAEKRAIAEMRRLSHADGGMAFKVRMRTLVYGSTFNIASHVGQITGPHLRSTYLQGISTSVWSSSCYRVGVVRSAGSGKCFEGWIHRDELTALLPLGGQPSRNCTPHTKTSMISPKTP